MAAICGLFERAALVAWPNDLGDPAAKQPVFLGRTNWNPCDSILHGFTEGARRQRPA
jgi:hypothetical protein